MLYCATVCLRGHHFHSARHCKTTLPCQPTVFSPFNVDNKPMPLSKKVSQRHIESDGGVFLCWPNSCDTQTVAVERKERALTVVGFGCVDRGVVVLG